MSATARAHASKPSAGSMDDPEIQAYFKGGYAAMRPGLKMALVGRMIRTLTAFLRKSYIRDGSRCLAAQHRPLGGPAAELQQLDVLSTGCIKGSFGWFGGIACATT